MKIEKTAEEVNFLSPLTWAYVGDSVYELAVRTHLVNQTNLKPHQLHMKAIQYVKAEAQAEQLKSLMDLLTEEEKEIVRRTRNTQNHHLPKNADPADYMYSTAFEGLIGYLYLTNQEERLHHIITLSLANAENMLRKE